MVQKLIPFAMVMSLLVGTLGLPHFGMPMMTMGHAIMEECLLPGTATPCTMTPLEHIASWQGMFTSIPALSFAGTTLLLIFLASLAGLVWARQVLAPPLAPQTISSFVRKRDYVPLHSPLQEFFSNGILNPKLH